MSLPRNLHNQAELKVVGMDWSKTKQDIWIKEDQQGTTNYLYPHQHGCKQTSPSARPSKIILYLPKSYHMFSPSNSHKTSFAAKSASTASASWSLDSAQIWIPQKNKKDRKGSNDQTLVSFWWCVKTSQFGPKFNDSLLYQYVCPSLFFSRMVIKANRLIIDYSNQILWETTFLIFLGTSRQSSLGHQSSQYCVTILNWCHWKRLPHRNHHLIQSGASRATCWRSESGSAPVPVSDTVHTTDHS